TQARSNKHQATWHQRPLFRCPCCLLLVACCMSKDAEYGARLFLAWVNGRYGRQFSPADLSGPVWSAEDGLAESGGRIVLVAARLSEAILEWDERSAELESRLNETRPGSYLLWVP